MIDYKLAKQLKEAGFPLSQDSATFRSDVQLRGGWYYKLVGMKEWGFKLTQSFESKFNKTIYVPTLSELIEACGDGFGVLYKFGEEWEIEGGKLLNAKELIFEIDIRKCKTPEEAVAKLYIKLNK